LGFGAYEFCLQKRRLEKINMKRAVEIIDRKKAEKAAEAERKRVERRRRKEEEEAAIEERKRSNWKFW
jgi:cytochrome c oxidase assembly protein subunit 20